MLEQLIRGNMRQPVAILGTRWDAAHGRLGTRGNPWGVLRAHIKTNRGPKGDPTGLKFRKHVGETGTTNCFAPYGNWERIAWTEMTGHTLRSFVEPVSGPFGLTKLTNLGNS